MRLPSIARRGHRVLLTAAVSAVVGLLATSATAVSLGPPDLKADPAGPSNAQAWTFTFSAAPDPGAQIVRYEGGFGDVVATITSPFATPPPAAADGKYEFRVRAVEITPLSPDEVAGPFRSVTITVDRTPPAPPKASFPGPDGDNGWYRTLTVRWTCSDPSGASCPSQTFTAAGRNQFARQVARDGAGNVSAEAVAGPFNFDNGAALASPLTPSPGAILTDEPTFVWRNATDPTSGQARSEVWARWTGVADQLIARVAAPAARSARNVRTTQLPIRTPIRWFVRYYDRAGNHSDSAARTFTIDPTPPSAAPVVTGGPAGPTNARAPEFSWKGDAPTFTWKLTVDGADAPAQEGRGPAQSITLQPLADGDYTFSVAQVTALGAEGPEATRSFTVDTVAPAAPVVTLRSAGRGDRPGRVRVDHRAGRLLALGRVQPGGSADARAGRYARRARHHQRARRGRVHVPPPADRRCGQRVAAGRRGVQRRGVRRAAGDEAAAHARCPPRTPGGSGRARAHGCSPNGRRCGGRRARRARRSTTCSCSGPSGRARRGGW